MLCQHYLLCANIVGFTAPCWKSYCFLPALSRRVSDLFSFLYRVAGCRLASPYGVVSRTAEKDAVQLGVDLEVAFSPQNLLGVETRRDGASETAKTSRRHVSRRVTWPCRPGTKRAATGPFEDAVRASSLTSLRPDGRLRVTSPLERPTDPFATWQDAIGVILCRLWPCWLIRRPRSSVCFQ